MSDDIKERLQKHDWKYLTARIEALEAQLAEAREWQPIETAPEGVPVWGWQPPQNGLHDCYGTVELVEQEDGAWFTHSDGEETFTPTRWMPANKPRRPAALPKDPTGSGS